MMTSKLLNGLAGLFAFALCSCNPPNLPTGGSGGFIMHTLYGTAGSPTSSWVNAGGVRFNMTWVLPDLPGAGGDASPIKNATTDADGLWASSNGRAPANLSFVWLSTGALPECASYRGNGLTVKVLKDQKVNIACIEGTTAIADPPSYSVHPNPLNIASLPSQISIEATPGTFTSTYGMPVAQYFDSSGDLVEQQPALSISSNGKFAYFSTGDINGIGTGTYGGLVSNINAQGDTPWLHPCTSP